MLIHILSPEVSAQIAAGEVVECHQSAIQAVESVAEATLKQMERLRQAVGAQFIAPTTSSIAPGACAGSGVIHHAPTGARRRLGRGLV